MMGLGRTLGEWIGAAVSGAKTGERFGLTTGAEEGGKRIGAMIGGEIGASAGTGATFGALFGGTKGMYDWMVNDESFFGSVVGGALGWGAMGAVGGGAFRALKGGGGRALNTHFMDALEGEQAVKWAGMHAEDMATFSKRAQDTIDFTKLKQPGLSDSNRALNFKWSFLKKEDNLLETTNGAANGWKANEGFFKS